MMEKNKTIRWGVHTPFPYFWCVFLVLFVFAALPTTLSARQSAQATLINDIVAQMDRAVSAQGAGFPNRVTLDKQGRVVGCHYDDWRSGFFPGSLWYMYDLTKDNRFLTSARRYTDSLHKAADITWSHDVGFIINTSFGNGWRITHEVDYRETIVRAARSLMTRFRPKAGVFQSWNVQNGWQSQRGWKCPVIIDNMMNLELLFKATQFTGDSTFYRAAVSHADRTLKEHFRPDGSCYHVVDYDPETGTVRSRQTAQGFSDESVWSRGQSWAIYGYTLCYRYTHDARYLAQAERTFDMMIHNPRMPKDGVPYWDMDAPSIPDEDRDVSSASCIASALYEMAQYDVDKGPIFRHYADKLLSSLSSSKYRAAIGTNGFFLLKHSVGSKPHKAEIDVPLNYADYYYLEALVRRQNLQPRR
jgi:rhamnogalacturonyl hydrolase YesR